MTIEKTLERIADALETIAASDRTLAAAVAETPPEPTPASRAPKKKKKATKKGETQTQVGTPDDDGGITKEEVRAALQSVQKATTPAQAKSILKAEGATTIGNLAASKYANVIEACSKILDE